MGTVVGTVTIKEFVVHALGWPPYERGATATQLCHFASATQRNVKLSSLSSVLKRMYDADELERIEGFGSRGGYGYRLKRGQ